MNKIKQFLKAQFTISISEISLLSIFIALWIVSSRFITIDLGFMRIGIVYAWPITIGLLFKPFVGVLGAIIADTISTLISNGGIGMWMWQYAIIYPLTVLIVWGMKTFLKKNNKWWWLISLVSTILVMVGSAIVIGLNNSFVKGGSNQDSFIDMSKGIAQPLIWSSFGVFVLFQIIIWSLYYFKRSDKIKNIIIISSIVVVVIILTIWIWGPIAQIEYIARFVHTDHDKSYYYSMYDVYLIPRIIKTPFIAPLYMSIIIPINRVSEYLIEHTSKNKW